jgi:hypothetical protein
MKKLKIFLAIFFTFSLSAQSVMDITYMDIPVTELGNFIDIHKEFTNITIEEGREINGQWVYRHWYGSGAFYCYYDIL